MSSAIARSRAPSKTAAISSRTHKTAGAARLVITSRRLIVPRFAASVYGHYERPIAGSLSMTADARAAFVGPSRLTFDAATAPEMGDYWATRLAVGLKAPDWRVGLYLDNALDDRGDTFAFGNPFTVRGQRHDTPQRPLTLGISLDWSF